MTHVWAERRPAPTPWAVALEPSTGAVAVASRYCPGAALLDADGRLRWSVDGLAHSPSAVAFSDDARQVVVATHLGSRLEALDAATGARVASVGVPFLGIAVAATGGAVYVVSRELAIVDVDGWTVRRTVPLASGATSIARVAGGLFVGIAGGVTKASLDGSTSVFPLGAGPFVVGADPAGSVVWVADHQDGQCRVLDATGAEQRRIRVRGHPWHIAVAGGRAFVVSPEENVVTVLSSATGDIVDELDVSRPWHVAFDAEREVLWCASPLDGVVRWRRLDGT